VISIGAGAGCLPVDRSGAGELLPVASIGEGVTAADAEEPGSWCWASTLVQVLPMPERGTVPCMCGDDPPVVWMSP
jgi:hypothetical protein